MTCMWYNKIKNEVRAKIRSWLLSTIDIAELDSFGDKDQERIKQWLVMSANHPGFHAYLKARDRQAVQLQTGVNVFTTEGQRLHSEVVGRRLELTRLSARAVKVSEEFNRSKAKRVKKQKAS